MNEDFRKKFLSKNVGGADYAEAWEYQCVKELLNIAPDPSALRRALYDTADSFGTNTWSFEIFHTAQIEFPIRFFSCAKSKKVAEFSFARLFNNFTGQFLLDEYSHACATAAELGLSKTPVGIVIKWPHVAGGVILHDYAYDFSSPGVRIFCTEEGYRLTLEPFRQFLKHLPHDAFI